MTRQEIIEIAEQHECQVPLLDPSLADFDSALVGYVTSAGGIRAVYDYDKCLQCLVEQNDDMTLEEAADTFSYNTERAIPYMGVLHPLILYHE